MPAALIPPNEAERLASVRRLGELGHAHRAIETILATLREQFRVDAAILSIVNESTQHPFLCDPDGAQATPRAAAFCAHVVYGGAPVVVPDATADDRFRDNPGVVAGAVGFYYGAPVYTPEGHVAGALCVQGPGARAPTDLEIALLRRLADLATEELRLARRFAEFERVHATREDHLRLMIRHAPAAIAMFDRQMRYLAVSEQWARDYRLTDADLVGRCHYDVFPEVPDAWKDDHRRCLEGETISTDHDTFTRADGSVDHLRYSLVPWRDADGRIGGLVMFTQVITGEVRRAREQDLNAKRLDLAVKAAQAGLWEWNLADHSVYLSDEGWSQIGERPDPAGVTSQALMERAHPDDRPAFQAALEPVVNGVQDAFTAEYRLRDADGAYRWFVGHGVIAERDAHGRAARIVGVRLDIHDRKLLQIRTETHLNDLARAKSLLEHQTQQLIEASQRAKAARKQAEQASQAKSQFLANMSHEIRTPMAAILGYTEVLADRQADERDREEAVATIRRNGEHLITLINEILDLSRIEAGRFEIDRAETDPGAVVREAAAFMHDLAARKGIDLRVLTEPSLPGRVMTDATRLRQVLVNLIGNAVKFTEKGAVTVRAWGDDTGVPWFEVRDTGIGMRPQDARRIFEPFMQADGSTTRRHGGSGLGLAISSRLADMLGGRVEVAHTAPGVGTTMRFFVDPGAVGVRFARAEPAQAASEPDAQGPGADGACLAGSRILLAEDGPDNQKLLSYMLTRAGASVTVVSDGAQAVEAVVNAEGEPFQLLLLDMQMPEMDGYEAALHLRSRGFRLPIIALTAHAMDGDRERCLRAGCDDYASKPVSGPALQSLCARWLARAGRSAA